MKKMRKAKVITALALTVVMLAAMTGLAAATDIKATPDGDLELVPNSYVETTASITDISGTGERTLKVAGPWLQDISDLTFKVHDPKTGVTSAESTGSIEYKYTPDTGSYVLTVYVKAALGTEGNRYTMWYADMSSDKNDVVVATVQGTSIPEFATIAIPVAAILGLVLFFNHRKHKKE
jgi:hypothetical protein